MTVKRHALAARRESVGHTQETLAEFVGVEPTTVGRWERGETCPQPWCRPKLAEGLSVSVEELDRLLAQGQPVKAVPTVDVETGDGSDGDLVLSALWSYRGTVESAVVLRGGDHPVKRRGLVFLSGLALTAPAHQWLIHEPEPLISGLSGRRVSSALADRFVAMIPELRAMDDVAGGGTVLVLAQQQFGMIAELLDQASYDEPTGRRLLVALAELGQLTGWAAFDAGQQSLPSATTSRGCGRRTAPMTGPSAPISSDRWRTRPPLRDTRRKPSPWSTPQWPVCAAGRRHAC